MIFSILFTDTLQRVLTMVYNTRNEWVFGLCPSSGILKKHYRTRLGNWICFHPQVSGLETPPLLCPLERANLSHWTMDEVQDPVILIVYKYLPVFAILS
jgi:hypothetical protein